MKLSFLDEIQCAIVKFIGDETSDNKKNTGKTKFTLIKDQKKNVSMKFITRYECYHCRLSKQTKQSAKLFYNIRSEYALVYCYY